MTQLSLQKIYVILNYSWDRSFSIIKHNKKTLMRRLWYPMNRSLLLDPGIISTKQESSNIVSPDRGDGQHGRVFFTLDHLNPIEDFTGCKMT